MFLNTVFDYHVSNLLYYLIFLVPVVILGAVIFMLRKGRKDAEKFTGFIFIDTSMICSVNIAANLMMYFAERNSRFLAAGIILLIISLAVIFWKKLLNIVVYAVLTAGLCGGAFLYVQMMGTDIFGAYCFLMILSVIMYAGIFSDILLFMFRKKLIENPERTHADNEHPVQGISPYAPPQEYENQYFRIYETNYDNDEDTENLHEETERKISDYNCAFVNALVILAAVFIFIIPTDFNFVNAPAYGYSYIFDYAAGNAFPASIETSAPADYYSYEETIPDRAELSEELSGYTNTFSTDVLSEYSESSLNCHLLDTVYLNNIGYNNKILASMKEAAGRYRMNPSYMLNNILNLDNSVCRFVSGSAPVNERPLIDLSSIDSTGMSDGDYVCNVFAVLMKNFSAIQEGFSDIKIAYDADGYYYTYFSLCDDEVLYYFTIFMYTDGNCNITGTDYSAVQFVNLNDSGVLNFRNYAHELSDICSAAFSDNMPLVYYNTYDTVLENDGDKAYMKKYECSYSKNS